MSSRLTGFIVYDEFYLVGETVELYDEWPFKGEVEAVIYFEAQDRIREDLDAVKKLEMKICLQEDWERIVEIYQRFP